MQYLQKIFPELAPELGALSPYGGVRGRLKRPAVLPAEVGFAASRTGVKSMEPIVSAGPTLDEWLPTFFAAEGGGVLRPCRAFDGRTMTALATGCEGVVRVRHAQHSVIAGRKTIADTPSPGPIAICRRARKQTVGPRLRKVY